MNTSKIQIISALVWAATLLIVAYSLGGYPKRETIFLILFTGANIHFLLLAKLHNSVMGIKGKSCKKPSLFKK